MRPGGGRQLVDTHRVPWYIQPRYPLELLVAPQVVAPQVTMMLIGNLAERAGVSTRTIRYYEELGMIQPEERTAGGFRRYSDEQLRRLTIIDNLKSLGFDDWPSP